MSNRVHCSSCGSRVDVPADFSRAKIRCPGCGYYVDVPADMRSAGAEPPPTAEPERPKTSDPPLAASPSARPVAPKAKPQAAPNDPRPRFEPDEDGPRGKPLLEGSQDEDDDKPYAVPGTGTKRCPDCRGELPLSAVFCVHCGREIATGQKVKKREFEPIDRTWEEGWTLQFRLQLLIGCVILDFLAFVTLLINGDMSVGIMGLVPQIALQAFLLGTYDRLNLKRTRKGEATMVRTRRVCFFEMPPTKVKWKHCESAGLAGSHNPGLMAWFFCLYMAMFCIVPAVLFYWFVIRPERFEVALGDQYGSTDEVVFRSTDYDMANEVGRLVGEATGLRYRSSV